MEKFEDCHSEKSQELDSQQDNDILTEEMLTFKRANKRHKQVFIVGGKNLLEKEERLPETSTSIH